MTYLHDSVSWVSEESCPFIAWQVGYSHESAMGRRPYKIVEQAHLGSFVEPRWFHRVDLPRRWTFAVLVDDHDHERAEASKSSILLGQ